jgi:purine nucleosidase
MTEKLLFDTDIGSDIDDAVALAYLLARPECELLGITTVSGKPIERAKIASAICRVAGADIPIYPGIEAPLSGVTRQPEVPQARALGRWPHETQFTEGRAIDFLREMIRAHPGEITLLAVGPMTNIAALFDADPEIPGLLKQLVMMIGHFTEADDRGEWNSYCDPDAAAKVFETETNNARSIGLDVTRQVVLTPDETRSRFKAPLLQPVRDFAEVWFSADNPRPLTFHDPLAAVVVFEPELCGYDRGDVTVSIDQDFGPGVTGFQRSPSGRYLVGATIKADAFFQHYFDVLEAFEPG